MPGQILPFKGDCYGYLPLLGSRKWLGKALTSEGARIVICRRGIVAKFNNVKREKGAGFRDLGS